MKKKKKRISLLVIYLQLDHHIEVLKIIY